MAQPAASALQPSLAPGGARLVPASKYVSASRLHALDQYVLMVAQEEFPAATNMDNKQVPQQNQTHKCKCCGLVGHELAMCGYTGLVGDLQFPGMIDLPGPWKILAPREARKLRLVSKAHSKLDAKHVGVS